jgi:hypothetical protein
MTIFEMAIIITRLSISGHLYLTQKMRRVFHTRFAQVAKIAKNAENVARFAFRDTELRILPRFLEGI